MRNNVAIIGTQVDSWYKFTYLYSNDYGEILNVEIWFVSHQIKHICHLMAPIHTIRQKNAINYTLFRNSFHLDNEVVLISVLMRITDPALLIFCIPQTDDSINIFNVSNLSAKATGNNT